MIQPFIFDHFHNLNLNGAIVEFAGRKIPPFVEISPA